MSIAKPHRTQITRYGRAWKYGYDKNGNVQYEIAPSPNPPTTDAAYTTTIVYDSLDRVASKAIGQRSLSTTDQALFATGTEQFTWDSGGNMKGRLTYWKTFAPNNPTPAITRTTFDTDQGAERDRKFDFSIAGLTGTREIVSTFTLSNKISSTTYNDGIGTGSFATSTVANYVYDARGLPQKIGYVATTGAASVDVGVQTRNVAGLVTSRITPSAANIESDWSYDSLGRVVSQVVQRPGQIGGFIRTARQDLTYFGNDDPATLTHWLGNSSKQFQFGYDQRHQLTSANESSTPGYFASSYSYGPGGRFTTANLAQSSPPTGSDLKPRNVNYVYADPDPERVTSLVNVSNGSRYASYTYDDAGNQTTRCYGTTASPCSGESLDYVYDGKNQLRRATKKNAGVVQGSEEYWYDADGNRLAVVKRNASGAKTETVVFVNDLEAHYTSTNSNNLNYTHLSMGTPVARVTRQSSSIAVEYQFHGLASSLLATVSSVGATNAAFSYSPFGELLETTGSDVASHRERFNEKYQDSLTDLSYYGRRYLDRTLIGWTQSDPLYRLAPDLAAQSSPRRANLSTFTLNNSLRYLDPDGADPGQASSVKIPESPQTLQQRELQSRIADEDWMIRISEAGSGPSVLSQILSERQACGGGLCDDGSVLDGITDLVTRPVELAGDILRHSGDRGLSPFASIIQAHRENGELNIHGEWIGGGPSGRSSLGVLSSIIGFANGGGLGAELTPSNGIRHLSVSELALIRGGAMSRKAALTRLDGLAAQVEAHLGKIANNPNSQALGHWRTEIQTWLRDMEAVLPVVGKKTGEDWTSRIASWRNTLGE